MKNSEAITLYRDRIQKAMIDCYRTVIECDGRIQYKLYVWEDGELERLEGVQGDTGWLQPREMEPRQLFEITTVDAPFIDIWDFSDEPKPEDKDAQEAMRQEIIDYLVDSYTDNLDELVDGIIADAEYAEQENDIRLSEM